MRWLTPGLNNLKHHVYFTFNKAINQKTIHYKELHTVCALYRFILLTTRINVNGKKCGRKYIRMNCMY